MTLGDLSAYRLCDQSFFYHSAFEHLRTLILWNRIFNYLVLKKRVSTDRKRLEKKSLPVNMPSCTSPILHGSPLMFDSVSLRPLLEFTPKRGGAHLPLLTWIPLQYGILIRLKAVYFRSEHIKKIYIYITGDGEGEKSKGKIKWTGWGYKQNKIWRKNKMKLCGGGEKERRWF